jgi:hypothetical protein
MYHEWQVIQYQTDTYECILIQFHALQIFVDCILKPQEGGIKQNIKVIS